MTKSRNAIADEADRWVVRLHSDQRTREDAEAFRHWLERDPRHAQAYADSVALWDGVGALADDEAAHGLLRPLREGGNRSRPRLDRRAALIGGFGAIAAGAAVAVLGPQVLNRGQVLRTAPGQQRQARLADGSSVLLNTDTVLRVDLRQTERRLFLDKGQAFFLVAKDKARPFRVFVGHDEVRALGTAFEVRRIGDTARVTLEEGRVAVYRSGQADKRLDAVPAHALLAGAGEPREALTPAVVLDPGQQVELAVASPIAVRQVDLNRTQAWRYGRMILDDAPLGDTVADLNRYGGTQIVLADPQLAQVRVSGVFHTGRPEDFVESVTAAFPVRVVRRDEGRIVLARR